MAAAIAASWAHDGHCRRRCCAAAGRAASLVLVMLVVSGCGGSGSRSAGTVPVSIANELKAHTQFHVRLPHLGAGYGYELAIYDANARPVKRLGLSFGTPVGGSVDITEHAPGVPAPFAAPPTGQFRARGRTWYWHGSHLAVVTFGDGVEIEIVGNVPRRTIRIVAASLW